jgi:hypothetical protein
MLESAGCSFEKRRAVRSDGLPLGPASAGAPRPECASERYGFALLVGLAVVAALIAAPLDFPYALEGVGELADILNL